MLATVLFTDIVGSTTRAAELGDRRWRELLDRHEEIATREVAARGGLVASFTGDGLVARFDGPARAVRCALALWEQLRGLGIQVRAGLHTGEIEVRGDAVAGIAVHIAARVMALAGTDDVLVSRTVRDLVAGSGLRSTIAARMCSRASPSPGRWSSRRAERAAGARRVVL